VADVLAHVEAEDGVEHASRLVAVEPLLLCLKVRKAPGTGKSKIRNMMLLCSV
jgi:hypothetical protein